MVEPRGEIKRAKSRPKRVPLTKQKTLNAHERPGYKLRWVNIEEDRIERFKKAGWSPVVGKSKLDEDAKSHESNYDSDNTVIKHVGGERSKTRAMLMEIPEEYYKEDQDAKQKRVDEIEDSYSPAKRAQRDPNRYDESNH